MVETTISRAEHDRRVSELLEANNREVERRRRVETALRIVLARITDTLAAGWLAPNPLANERCAAAQYRGTLADFIRTAIGEAGNG